MVLSFTALLSVFSGYTHAPLPDEGTAAHIFQLSIVALVPMIFLFLATADWTQPLRNLRRLAFPAASFSSFVCGPVLARTLLLRTTLPITAIRLAAFSGLRRGGIMNF